MCYECKCRLIQKESFEMLDAVSFLRRLRHDALLYCLHAHACWSCMMMMMIAWLTSYYATYSYIISPCWILALAGILSHIFLFLVYASCILFPSHIPSLPIMTARRYVRPMCMCFISHDATKVMEYFSEFLTVFSKISRVSIDSIFSSAFSRTFPPTPYSFAHLPLLLLDHYLHSRLRHIRRAWLTIGSSLIEWRYWRRETTASFLGTSNTVWRIYVTRSASSKSRRRIISSPSLLRYVCKQGCVSRMQIFVKRIYSFY